MKSLLTLTAATCFTLAASLAATSAGAYEINGSSDTNFVLKCNDGTTNTSSMPPNHNTATEFCADHGGVAAGYPRKVIQAQKNSQLSPSSTGGSAPIATFGSQTKATDYNSSRSNKSY